MFVFYKYQDSSQQSNIKSLSLLERYIARIIDESRSDFDRVRRTSKYFVYAINRYFVQRIGAADSEMNVLVTLLHGALSSDEIHTGKIISALLHRIVSNIPSCSASRGQLVGEALQAVHTRNTRNRCPIFHFS